MLLLTSPSLQIPPSFSSFSLTVLFCLPLCNRSTPPTTMAKKKNNNKKNEGGQNDNDQNQNQNQNQNEEKKKKKGGDEATPTTIVLKVDMHCKGCASRIVKCLHGFQGVETVKAESEIGKLTITGNVDPAKLRDKLARKMKKQVDLISPVPKKEKEIKPQNQNKNDDKKQPKEAPVTTAVLKVELHCQGCTERIRNTVSKTKGVHHVAIDKEKETVTVKGTMDVKALVANLTERLRRKVVVVPPKNEKEKGKENENEGAAGEGKKKQKGGEGGGGENQKVVEQGKGKADQQNKMEIQPQYANGYGYGYAYYGYEGYEPVYIQQLPAPEMFSDENPNACSIM